MIESHKVTKLKNSTSLDDRRCDSRCHLRFELFKQFSAFPRPSRTCTHTILQGCWRCCVTAVIRELCILFVACQNAGSQQFVPHWCWRGRWLNKWQTSTGDCLSRFEERCHTDTKKFINIFSDLISLCLSGVRSILMPLSTSQDTIFMQCRYSMVKSRSR